jgi:hypothetical protein
MSSGQRRGPKLETRFKVPFLGTSWEWRTTLYLAFALTIAVSAALSALLTLTVPFLAVRSPSGHLQALTACLVALLYDHLTGFDPLNFAQLIDHLRFAPSDILARWIYLPVLGLISFLLTLPSHFGVSVEEPSGRHAFAAGAALASLLYVILLLAFPIDNVIYGQCLCADPLQSVRAGTADLRWGFYLALLVSLYNIVANEILTGIEPFWKWMAPPEPKAATRRWIAPSKPKAAAWPTVIKVSPAGGATGVSIRPIVTATFSKAMDGSTITPSTFTLADSNGMPVDGKVSYNTTSREATFTPSDDLKPGTPYCARISGRVTDDARNALGANCVWSFSTAQAPKVDSVTPEDGKPQVPTTTRITAAFSVPMKRTTISRSTFLLRDPSNTDVDGKVDYNDVTREATFTPTDSLTPNTRYEAIIVEGSSGVESTSGFTLAGRYKWTFTTTGLSPVPPSPVPPSPVPPASVPPASVPPQENNRQDTKGHSSGSRWHFYWCRKKNNRSTDSDFPPHRPPIYPPAWPIGAAPEVSGQPAYGIV